MCPQEHKGYAVAFNAIAFLFHDAHELNGVALMFLRAHGRKSMPVCLEALMFLCSPRQRPATASALMFLWPRGR